jgi:short chain dehydrogenase
VDEVALVTGGTKGIGYACAERLLADGYAVALCARNADQVSAAASRLGAPDRVLGLRADVGSVENCAGLVPAVLERFGRVDVLVNNAGVYRPVPFLDQPAAARRPGHGDRRRGLVPVRERRDLHHRRDRQRRRRPDRHAPGPMTATRARPHPGVRSALADLSSQRPGALLPGNLPGREREGSDPAGKPGGGHGGRALS